MKKINVSVLMMALLAAFTFGFTSCSEDDEVIDNAIVLDQTSFQILTGGAETSATITGSVTTKEKLETLQLFKDQTPVFTIDKDDFDGTQVTKEDNNNYTFSFEVSEAGNYQLIATDKDGGIISSQIVTVAAISVSSYGPAIIGGSDASNVGSYLTKSGTVVNWATATADEDAPATIAVVFDGLKFKSPTNSNVNFTGSTATSTLFGTSLDNITLEETADIEAGDVIYFKTSDDVVGMITVVGISQDGGTTSAVITISGYMTGILPV